jgi:hypothetical protein
MVQVIDTGGNLGTRLGRAAGTGIAQALPKEVERMRLSQGLKNLGNLDMSNPMDAVSQLLSIPGMTSDKAQIIFPFLQQQMQRKEAAQRGQAGQATGQSQAALQPNDLYSQATQGMQSEPQQGQIPNIQNLPQMPTEGEPLPPQGLISPEEQQMSLQEFSPLGHQEKLGLASQLMTNYPSRFPNEQSAMDEIERMEANRREIFEKPRKEIQNKAKLQEAAELEFNKQVAEKTQAGLNENPVWGDLMGDLRGKMLQEVRNGATVKDSAAKYGKIANEVAQALTKLEERGGESLWKARPEANRDLFKDLGSKFQKLGKEKEYAQMLSATQNIPLAYAHPFAYPLKNNKDLESYINGVKNIGTNLKFQLGDKGYLDLAEDIMSKLKGGDSPLTAVLALKNKGIDDGRLLEILKSQYKDKFTTAQWEALSGVTRLEPNLSSTWLYSFSGMP